MTEAIISVTNLGKSYRISHQGDQQRYTTLRDVIMDKARRWFPRQKSENSGRAVPSRGASVEQFWALQDVSFEVKRGEVVGIIGRNGAGKSTLLKVLSRITEPTKGRVHLRGRVASLLEVGTGFHPELTGRENVFLNGAILGMSRAEIRRKFDEIVAFAEVEKFLDTPVKRYSSGMYVRLAFAVAAHLEPEILIVDEVLAVGDSEFQKKCMGKMKDVAGQGRTVLFVSHNLGAVSTLCTSAMLLMTGRIVFRGEVDACIASYSGAMEASNSVWEQKLGAKNDSPASFQRACLTIAGTQPNLILHLKCQINSAQKHRPAFLAVDIMDASGQGIMQAIPTLEGFVGSEPLTRHYEITIDLPPLVPGHYSVSLWMGPHNSETYDHILNAIGFEILESPTPGRSFPHTRNHGCIVPHSKVHLLPEI